MIGRRLSRPVPPSASFSPPHGMWARMLKTSSREDLVAPPPPEKVRAEAGWISVLQNSSRRQGNIVLLLVRSARLNLGRGDPHRVFFLEERGRRRKNGTLTVWKPVLSFPEIANAQIVIVFLCLIVDIGGKENPLLRYGENDKKKTKRIRDTIVY